MRLVCFSHVLLTLKETHRQGSHTSSSLLCDRLGDVVTPARVALGVLAWSVVDLWIRV